MITTKNRKKHAIISKDNAEKEYNARWLIINALSDGKWHRRMKLKKETGLSSSTLAKHLKDMEKFKVIEKKKDDESGKYPCPVFFKAKPALIEWIIESNTIEYNANESILELNATKDYEKILEKIHIWSEVQFAELLRYTKQNKNATKDEINFLAECFLWADYKKSTSKLIEASRKIINDLKITQYFNKPLQRQTEGHKEVLKFLKKME